MSFSIWNDDFYYAKQAYSMDNYKIIDTNCSSNKCLILFSSNGLFKPNTKEAFETLVLQQNRFEWENLIHSDLIFKTYSRIILFRDCYLQWYIKGINPQINDWNKLIAFIKSLIPPNADITTGGNSAGGFMAVLAGILLNASHCISFSGQNSLWLEEDSNPCLLLSPQTRIPHPLSPSEIEDRIQFGFQSPYDFYSLAPLLEQRPIPVFYYYASRCDYDLENRNLISCLPNVHSLGFPYRSHAATMFIWNMPYILSMDTSELISLHKSISKEALNPFVFSLKTMPKNQAVIQLIKKLIRIITGKA